MACNLGESAARTLCLLVLFAINLLNYMDRMTVSGMYICLWCMCTSVLAACSVVPLHCQLYFWCTKSLSRLRIVLIYVYPLFDMSRYLGVLGIEDPIKAEFLHDLTFTEGGMLQTVFVIAFMLLAPAFGKVFMS